MLQHASTCFNCASTGGSAGKEPVYNARDTGDMGDTGLISGLGISPGGMGAHSSILAWGTPWTEEPGWLQSIGRKELSTTEVTEHSTAHASTNEAAVEAKKTPLPSTPVPLPVTLCSKNYHFWQLKDGKTETPQMFKHLTQGELARIWGFFLGGGRGVSMPSRHRADEDNIDASCYFLS